MKPGEVPPGPWDPGLFKDDDGHWYLYWDSSNVFPIYGHEDRVRGRQADLQGQADRRCSMLHPDQHGWERFGQDHSGLLANGQPTKPYVEGAWMTKTAANIICSTERRGPSSTSTPTAPTSSDKPLGPFTYAAYNPIAYKPGGFVQGAGHGSTFEDRYGNWWNTGTPWIGYNWTFERRINMFPAKFEADGQMCVLVALRRFPAIRADVEGRRPEQPVHRLDAAVVPQAGERPPRPWASSRPTG